MNNIAEAIRQMAQSGRPTVSLICRVDSVDREARTVDCTPIDESAPLLGVNLQANQGSRHGVVVWPKVGSYVVVGFVADGRAGVVLLADETEGVEAVVGQTTFRVDESGCFLETSGGQAAIDETGIMLRCGEVTATLREDGITLNGDAAGGLVKIAALEENLNRLKRYVEAMKSAVASGMNAIGSGTTASGTAGATVFETNMGSAVIQYENMENEKVKHG